jgi:arylsulfatase A-like enzyme
LWENCRWALRADALYADLAVSLLEREPFDVTLVYLGGPDVVGHRFWLWREPELYAYRPPDGEVADLGGVIDDYYVYVDGLLGRLVSAAPPRTRVLVLADHGMHPVNRETRFDPRAPTGDVNSGHHLDAPPGMLVASGAGFRPRTAKLDLADLSREDLPVLANVLDIAPTLLALLGIPIGQDMPGAPAAGLLDEATRARAVRISTHDTAEWRAEHARLHGNDPGEGARLEQLRDLGYVGDR